MRHIFNGYFKNHVGHLEPNCNGYLSKILPDCTAQRLDTKFCKMNAIQRSVASGNPGSCTWGFLHHPLLLLLHVLCREHSLCPPHDGILVCVVRVVLGGDLKDRGHGRCVLVDRATDQLGHLERRKKDTIEDRWSLHNENDAWKLSLMIALTI